MCALRRRAATTLLEIGVHVAGALPEVELLECLVPEPRPHIKGADGTNDTSNRGVNRRIASRKKDDNVST
jgi:hypothetical protein